jgi:toxin ParE1/3/4
MALKITFLGRARQDLIWFKIYHEQYFPEGMAKANVRFKKSIQLLTNFPNMGRVVGRLPRRCLAISNTPYTIVYRANENRLEIIRILDQRSENYLQDLMDNDHTH